MKPRQREHLLGLQTAFQMHVQFGLGQAGDRCGGDRSCTHRCFACVSKSRGSGSAATTPAPPGRTSPRGRPSTFVVSSQGFASLSEGHARELRNLARSEVVRRRDTRVFRADGIGEEARIVGADADLQTHVRIALDRMACVVVKQQARRSNRDRISRNVPRSCSSRRAQHVTRPRARRGRCGRGSKLSSVS